MTSEEADTLGKRIINTFRLTPALPEWRDVLATLNHAQAMHTFERCRDTIDGALSIKRFRDEYRALHTNRADGPTCQHCAGTGWITATTDDAPHRYAKPCICGEGQRAAKLDMRHSTPWPVPARPVETLAFDLGATLEP